MSSNDSSSKASVKAVVLSAVALLLAIVLLACSYFKPSWLNMDDTEEETFDSAVFLTSEQKRLIAKEEERLDYERLAALDDQDKLAKQQRINSFLKYTKRGITKRKWQVAERNIKELENEGYSATKLASLRSELARGKELSKGDDYKAGELIKAAKLLYTGDYSPEAIAKLNEALEIYPGYEAAEDLRNEINSRPYSLKVPEDVATLAEASQKLRPGDTVILGKGKHKLTGAFNIGIKIKGQGEKLTTIQSLTLKGSALALMGTSQSYEISDLTVEGLSYEDDALDRYPLIMVGAKVTMKNVTVKNGSGHGVAVVGGELEMSKCNITGNAWNGISIMGAASSARVSSCEINGNYEHGVEFWKGATGKLKDIKINDNISSGVVVMGTGTMVEIEQVQAMRNRHCGILINSQSEVSLDRVVSSENLYSGVVIQDLGTKVKFGIVIANKNAEAGFLISPSAEVENFATATSEDNKGGDIIKRDLKNLP